MKRDTILDVDRARFVYRAIAQHNVGECIHDKFLEELCNRMCGSLYGIHIPKLIYPMDRYNFVENYRQITDKDDIGKIVYVYFDHPVMESPLYLSTFDIDIQKQLLGKIRDMAPDFRSTLYNQSPITIKVPMDLFCNASEMKISYWDKQTLRYMNQPALSQDSLFDVVDVGYLPKEFLDMMK